MTRKIDGDVAMRVMNAITRHQTGRWEHPVHPLTCGNDSRHAPLFPFWNEQEQRMELWCADCDYTQTNAAMFSTKGEEP